MKLIWYGYLVSSLGICAHKTPTEIGLRSDSNSNQIVKSIIKRTNE